MNAVILIPARYGSSRYPGKPLVTLKGSSGVAKPLIQRSVEAARRVAGISGVFVTTDDERIADACTPARVGAIMTSSYCRNGTSVAPKRRDNSTMSTWSSTSRETHC